MTLLLAAGFVVVATGGAVFRYRGRRAAGVVLAAAGVAGLAVAVLVAGRDGMSDVVIGALAGLPVLIAGVAARERAESRSLPRLPGPEVTRSHRSAPPLDQGAVGPVDDPSAGPMLALEGH